ncbi:hypothetical protein E2562_011346, partial [Oryza meyeriana var. granulata]
MAPSPFRAVLGGLGLRSGALGSRRRPICGFAGWGIYLNSSSVRRKLVVCTI